MIAQIKLIQSKQDTFICISETLDLQLCITNLSVAYGIDKVTYKCKENHNLTIRVLDVDENLLPTNVREIIKQLNNTFEVFVLQIESQLKFKLKNYLPSWDKKLLRHIQS